MKEFSDKFIKELFEEKSEEYNPQDDLQIEWKNIDNSINSTSNIWVKLLTILIVFLSAFSLSIRYGSDDLKSDLQNGYSKEEISNKNIIDISESTDSGQISQKGGQDYTLNNYISENKNDKENDAKAEKPNGADDININTYHEKNLNNESKKNNLKYINSIGYKLLADKSSLRNLLLFDNSKKEASVNMITDEEENLKADRQKIEFYIGAYYNFNRFVPHGYDDTYITTFDQSYNPLTNRLGLQMSLELSGFASFLGKLKPVIGYSVLNKSYSYHRGSIYYESLDELDEISSKSTNHFLTIGFKLINKRNFIIGLNLHRNILRSKDEDNIVFSKNYLFIEIAKEWKIERNKKPIIIRPFVQYGIPLNDNIYYNTFPVNMGLLFKLK